MAQDYAASISGAVIRLTRLNADGTTMVGPSASYVTRGFIHFTITPQYEAGTDTTIKAADGAPCVTYQTPDTLKRVNVSVAICNPDPEFTEMISGGTILSSGGQSNGWAAAPIGSDPTPNGVAIEVWSKAIVNGKVASTNPYWHWLVPFAVLRQTGDRVIQDGVLATDFSGWGTGNSVFHSGAAPLWAYTTDRAYAYARTASIPAGTGYVATT